MDRQKISDEVQEILRDVVDDDTVTINDATVAEDVPDWDSANHIRLIIAIERHFKVRFETEEITKPESVGELVDLIQSKLA